MRTATYDQAVLEAAKWELEYRGGGRTQDDSVLGQLALAHREFLVWFITKLYEREQGDVMADYLIEYDRLKKKEQQ